MKTRVGVFDRAGALKEIITVDRAVRLYKEITGGKILKCSLIYYISTNYRHLGLFRYQNTDSAVCEGIRQKRFIYFLKTRMNFLKSKKAEVIFGDEHV
jgi:hypothetical protein